MLETNRSKIRSAFLSERGLNSARMDPLPGDASFRRYFRLLLKNQSYIMMDAPPSKENIEPFILMADHLSSLGFRVPAIFEKDVERGLMIIEDFGDDTYTNLLKKGADPVPLYNEAVDALLYLHRHPLAKKINLLRYDLPTFLEEAVLFIDWYWPELRGEKCGIEIRRAYLKAWEKVFRGLPKIENTLVLRDYHVGNLMQLGGGKKLSRLGIIDFQDALIGPAPYDLVSLIEDARRDNLCIAEQLLSRYLDSIEEQGLRKFKRWYSVLGANRHAKCAGIFVRLWRRDGKKGYLKYLPHVLKMLALKLISEDLAPVEDWFHRYFPKFQKVII